MNAGFWIFLLVLGPILLFVLWLILLETSVRIEPGTLGLGLLRGRSTGRVMGPGRHFIRPWRKVMIQTYPSRELALIAGGLQQSNPDVDYIEEAASVFLGDGSSASVQYTVRCQLDPAKLQTVHDTYGPEGIWSVLRDVSRQSVISECGSSDMTINDMFGEGYGALETRISEGLQAALAEVGFTLKMFSLREVDLGPAGEVVQARVRAGAELERENALAEVRRARVENDTAILADNESLDRGQLLRYRQIEAWNDLLEKWDGREHIPTLLTSHVSGWAANVPNGEAESGRDPRRSAGRLPVTATSWQNQNGSGGTVQVHRIIEVLTVLLLAIATIGSAWCAYQVSQWNGRETDAARASAVARINGSREYALATQKVTYDAASIAQYAEAVVAGNEGLQTFLRASIIRPGFLPKLDEWEAFIDDTGQPPPNLVEDTEYLGALFADSNEYDEAALAASLEGDEAGRNADDYIVTTLFMASALFFAGVTASFSSRMTRIMLLTASALTLGYAAARIAGYPIA